MSEITLSIPGDTLLALKVRPDQLGAELRLAGSRQAIRARTDVFGRGGEARRRSENGQENETILLFLAPFRGNPE